MLKSKGRLIAVASAGLGWLTMTHKIPIETSLGVLIVLVVVVAVLLDLCEASLERHHKALVWFTEHIKRDDHMKPDEMPDELKEVMKRL